MTSNLTSGLLALTDPHPVAVTNSDGESLFLLLGDHAGNAVPERLADLGLPLGELQRHIGWDIGVALLGARLAALLDATFMAQRYSRLVIDCNRDPRTAESVAPVSDGTSIPANHNVTPEERAERRGAILEPYQEAIGAMLHARDDAGLETIVVSLHSFTPELAGERRPWQIGVLHDGGDADFAKVVLQVLQDRGDIVVGDNQPYHMDATDYTVPLHAYAAGRRYVELEIRQDLLNSDEGIENIAMLLRDILVEAAQR